MQAGYADKAKGFLHKNLDSLDKRMEQWNQPRAGLQQGGAQGTGRMGPTDPMVNAVGAAPAGSVPASSQQVCTMWCVLAWHGLRAAGAVAGTCSQDQRDALWTESAWVTACLRCVFFLQHASTFLHPCKVPTRMAAIVSSAFCGKVLRRVRDHSCCACRAMSLGSPDSPTSPRTQARGPSTSSIRV